MFQLVQINLLLLLLITIIPAKTTCVNILGTAGSPGRIGWLPELVLSTPGKAERLRVQTLVMITIMMLMILVRI